MLAPKPSDNSGDRKKSILTGGTCDSVIINRSLSIKSMQNKRNSDFKKKNGKEVLSF